MHSLSKCKYIFHYICVLQYWVYLICQKGAANLKKKRDNLDIFSLQKEYSQIHITHCWTPRSYKY